MRVHVYDEELTEDVEVIRKDGVIGADGEPTTFYGLRLWLEASPSLHRTEHDDDRPAVTIWAHDLEQLEHIVNLMAHAVEVGQRRRAADRPHRPNN